MAKKQLLKIEGVYFAYTNIDKPRKDTFDTSGLTKKFNATVFLNKEQRKFFKEQKLNKTVKEIDTKDFEAKYKFAAPYPDQDEQYYIQVSKKATYKDGNLKPEFTFPRAYFVNDGSVIEGTSTLIGNGSFGDIRLELDFNPTLNSTSVILDSVLIKEHVPYQSSGDEWASAAGVPTYVESPVKAKTTTQSAFNDTEHTDLGDDLPF